jgi:Melibiase
MKKQFVEILILITLSTLALSAQEVQFRTEREDGKVQLILSNSKISYTIVIDGKTILSDKLETIAKWSKKFNNNSAVEFNTDGGFAFDVMYSDWRAPGKKNNGDNPVILDKSLFEYQTYDTRDYKDGSKELILKLKGLDISPEVSIKLLLAPNDFYLKKKVSISDSAGIGHFLRIIYPVYSKVSSKCDPVKKGDFGQPVALLRGDGGLFFGIEYPGSTNLFIKTNDEYNLISCGQEMGLKIGPEPIESEWTVLAATPDEFVKNWFMQYVDDIRVKKLEPYTLYNSWYDLRSAEYPEVPQENVMNEQNSLRIIGLIRKNFVEKNGIKLDAFVLDDGWDLYKSDWAIRESQFPHGFTPLVEELKKINAGLGLWFGPSGGYSFRMDRINWMRDHGYETVGRGKNSEMLCIAGKKYSGLFDKRITEMIKNYNVGFFKLDGIQFSCNESSHGHPIDIYSRRAVIESLIEKTMTARSLNPNIFLNITSGTWLSPWWVKYANQIWMDGSDFGFADVPAVSPRDASITYRDMGLYEDFALKDLWFPISNMMTHGIIKGKLEKLGGEEEPIEKFTDESVIYFARGVSMWELYISPDILTEPEWNAISKSIRWARDKFDILKLTYMFGGDPGKGEPYGYAHFKNERGILVARNPVIAKAELTVKLDPAFGCSRNLDSLVLERTYPTRWISPKLYSTGDKIDLPLGSYETAVYEIYPLKNAHEPLIAGARFDRKILDKNNEVFDIYEITGKFRVLNPSSVQKAVIADSSYKIDDISLPELKQNKILLAENLDIEKNSNRLTLTAEVTIDSSMASSELSVLFKPNGDYTDKPFLNSKFYLDEREVKTRKNSQTGRWEWWEVDSHKGKNHLRVEIEPNEKARTWKGKAEVWLTGNQSQKSRQIRITAKNPIDESVLPPSPFQTGQIRNTVLVDDITVKLTD